MVLEAAAGMVLEAGLPWSRHRQSLPDIVGYTVGCCIRVPL